MATGSSVNTVGEGHVRQYTFSACGTATVNWALVTAYNKVCYADKLTVTAAAVKSLMPMFCHARYCL